MTDNPNASDDFLGGNAKSATFPTVGTSYSGTITRVGEPQQQKDPADGKPKTYDDGNPVMVLPVEIQTSVREDADDDGKRTIWVASGIRFAVRDAVRKAGAKGLREGGMLTITLTTVDAPTRPGINGVKHYAASYTPPAATAAADAFTAGTPESAPDFAQPAQAAPAAPAAPSTPEPTTPAAQAKELIAAGLDDAVIAQATGLPTVAIAAMRQAG